MEDDSSINCSQIRPSHFDKSRFDSASGASNLFEGPASETDVITGFPEEIQTPSNEKE